MSSAPVPGVVNVHQGITPGGSPQVKALRNTEKKIVGTLLANPLLLVTKKYIDDVSGVEKLHSSHLYNSKVVNGKEIRYIHAIQAQGGRERCATSFCLFHT